MASAPCIDVPFVGMSCLEQCQSLFEAYTQALSGKQRVRIQYANYYTEYRPTNPGDLTMLLNLYTQLRNQCPEAVAALPDLNPANRVRRGPASFGTYRRG